MGRINLSVSTQTQMEYFVQIQLLGGSVGTHVGTGGKRCLQIIICEQLWTKWDYFFFFRKGKQGQFFLQSFTTNLQYVNSLQTRKKIIFM